MKASTQETIPHNDRHHHGSNCQQHHANQQQQHLPDTQSGGYRRELHYDKNDPRLDDAVLQISVLRPKLKIFFKRLDNDSHHHVDHHEHDEEDEQVVPNVCGVWIYQKLVIEVAGAEESACGCG